LGIFWY